jgi:3-oxoacyl-[acyl-carrier protein] reductase
MAVSLSLEGKVALITGGSRGIGAATVRAFAQAGAKVLFNYQTAKVRADALVKECGQERCAAVACNLAGLETAGELVAEVVTRFGRLDILVANHGIWAPQDAPVDKMTDAQWSGTVAVNLDSVFSLLRHSVAQMKKQNSLAPGTGGHIVVISSTAGQRGEAFHVDYAATKGALISMVKGLSTELAPDGIHVNCVAPGWVGTEMSTPVLNDPKTRDAILSTIPLGRVGTAEQIAMPILFLCTEHAGFITGEVFNVNGGAVLAG